MALNFLKTGAASAQLAKQAAMEQELRKQEQGKMFRFWLKDKEEGRITFIDGDLEKTGPQAGQLCPPRYYEHNIKMLVNGQMRWNNFYACPERTDPLAGDKCPICEGGEKPAMVALFTIIDHRQIQSKDKTKNYTDTKKLFVAKQYTFDQLNRKAIKQGGLAGCTFEVVRHGDKSASVGSEFDFIEKHDLGALQKLYVIEKVDPKTNVKTKVTNFTPADYEKEIIHYTGEQLRAIVKGKAMNDVDPIPFEQAVAKGAVDYSDQL